MKKLLLALLFLPLIALGYTSPGKPSGFVNDFAQILKPETVSNLNQTLSDFEKSNGAEIAVVTIPTYGSDETIETYAEKLFQEWGIGKADADNGLLLLIARDNREMRIEVGYGLEPVITDITSAHIIDDLIAPAFQVGEYDMGVNAAVQTIMKHVVEGEPYVPLVRPFGEKLASFLSGFGIILFILAASILGASKSWWAGGILGAILGIIFFTGVIAVVVTTLVGLLFDYIVSQEFAKSRKNGIHPPWWIGGGPGGGKGGGFGGFGGGMSGGGGASGRW